MPRKQLAFSPEYIEKCFVAWMAAGHPDRTGQDMTIFPEDEYGRRPTTRTIRYWRQEYGWDDRADDIELRAIEQVNNEIVIDKANILREQYENSRRIAGKALEYLISGTFDSSSSAVSAYFKATEEQRRSVGISEVIEKMSKMTPAELEDEILKRLRRATEAGQIIEGEFDTEDTEEDSS